MVKIKTATLDGKPIAYSDETEFLVQVGKGNKASYETKYRFVGNLGQAVAYFRAVNIGNGYKKRLYAPTMNKPVLARAAS